MSIDPIALIEAHAAEDEAFRQALIADPRGTIEASEGLVLPADWRVQVTDNGDGTVTVGFVDDELPADYLDLVAGGGNPLVQGGDNPITGSCPAPPPPPPGTPPPTYPRPIHAASCSSPTG